MATDYRQFFFARSQDILASVDAQGHVLYANESWLQILGYAPDEVNLQPLSRFLHPDDREQSVGRIQRLLISGEIQNFESRLLAKDGSTHWFAWSVRAAREEGRLYGIGREITGEKVKQAIFDKVLERVSSETGEAFLTAIARVLGKELGWDVVAIARLNPAETHASTLRFWSKGTILPNIDYALKGTACEKVVRDEFCVYTQNVAELFPEDSSLREFTAYSYIGQTISNSDGQPIGILKMLHSGPAHMIDIASRLIRLLAMRVGCEIERQEHERRVIESEARYRFLADQATDMIHKCTLEGEWTFVNPASEKIIGYRAEELLGKNGFQLVHPDDLDLCRSYLQTLIETGKPQVLCARLQSKDGNWHWLETTAQMIRDPRTSTPSAILAVSRDVTLRMIEEAERRKAYYRQMLHVQRTPLGVIELNLRGEIVEWNPAAERIFGWSKESIIGKHFSIITLDDQRDQVSLIWTNLLKQKGGYGSINDNVRADGRRITCEWYNTPLVAADGSTIGVASLVQDLTERKITEQLIENQRLQMIAASKMSSLGEMAAGIAHEINNPLAIIFGRADQLAALADRENISRERVRSVAEKITSTAERIARIVSGLRFFARDGTRDRFAKKPLSKLLEDTLAFCQSRFKHHNISVEIDPSISTIEIECRAVQISQVLLNLLNNAFDAVQASADPWVRLETKDLGDEVEIRITDCGKGIPADIASRIMTPFFTTKEVGKGTGLGLSISRGIVESHHGSLEIDRKHPNTSFVLRLPKTQNNSASSRHETVAETLMN